MKLKGISKLILAGTALAATAATLTTSTYAWYVTNSEATVDGIQSSAKAGGLGNVLVAQASTATTAVNGHGSFMQDITLDSTNLKVVSDSTNAGALNPATPVSATEYKSSTDSTVDPGKTYFLVDSTDNTKYNKVDNPSGNPKTQDYYEFVTTPATKIDSTTKWVDADGKELKNGSYIQFDIWILSTSETTVNFNFTVKNTTQSSAVAKQLSYASTGCPVAQGQEFSVDIVDALRLAYTGYTGAYDSTNKTYATADSASTIFDVASTASPAYVSDSTVFNSTEGKSANDYYEAVLGHKPLVSTGVTAAGTNTQTITVTANTEMKLSFYIWLEGPDNSCFDSCAGQSFEVELKFTTNQA